ncbi:hypothetical protein GCM10027417_10600 [Glutamicibacter endophyticus]
MPVEAIGAIESIDSLGDIESVGSMESIDSLGAIESIDSLGAMDSVGALPESAPQAARLNDRVSPAPNAKAFVRVRMMCSS